MNHCGMSIDKFASLFEEHENEAFKFENIPSGCRLSGRRDLNAFLLLDKLVPSTHNVVCGAEHDKIWLHTSIGLLLDTITEDQVVDLIRCGVGYDVGCEALWMFT
jgi:hypothetical protein